MFHIHKWSKWERALLQVTGLFIRTPEFYWGQKRVCQKCGLEQLQ